VKRRIVIAGLAALRIVPGMASTQPAEGKIPRVGILTQAASERAPMFGAFREGLRELGYVEGRNVVLEFRFARGDLSRGAELAEELVSIPVDVIVNEGVPAAMDPNGRVPIVSPVLQNPVPRGFAVSFTLMHAELNAKRVELLRTAFPQITAVSALVNPTQPAHRLAFEQTETAARSLGLGNVQKVEADSLMALRSLRPQAFSGADAVIVLPEGIFYNYRRDVVALINAARLPAIYPERDYADDGGLMAYGANVADNFRRAADYVDRILKGARPGDLPIQEPVKFDFVVNLKTARELGLTIPPLILGRADEVIE
jgi:putative tryptophan/tyrosine transport system substrate-binding protein